MDNTYKKLGFLHEEFDLLAGDIVEVTLDAPANVMLLDPANFSNYKDGLSYRYHGGYVEESPARLVTPRPGKWHVVVNLGGYPGSVSAVVRIYREQGVASTA
jgi:Domain of unknown function (DUF1883)